MGRPSERNVECWWPVELRYLVCSAPLADIGPFVLESSMSPKQTTCRVRGITMSRVVRLLGVDAWMPVAVIQ